MTLHNIILKYRVLQNIIFKTDQFSLDIDTKVKLLNMRIYFGKFESEFQEDLKKFSETILPEEAKILTNKSNKTQEDLTKLASIKQQYNLEQQCYIKQRSQENVEAKDFSITSEEFDQIVKVNIDNDVEINGKKLTGPDFLEVIYNLFVK